MPAVDEFFSVFVFIVAVFNFVFSAPVVDVFVSFMLLSCNGDFVLQLFQRHLSCVRPFVRPYVQPYHGKLAGNR